MNLDYCYHTHTARCGHAQGTDREYVEAAIAKGIKDLGFSDHVFIPGLTQEHTRGDYSMLDDYVSSLKALKEEYKDRINIHIGFEAEYSDHLKDYYKKLLDEGTIDYLICGQHFYFDSPISCRYIHDFDQNQAPRVFVGEIIKAIKSGLFSYIAHPDIFMLNATEYDPYFDEAIEEICRCSKEYDVPLEINLHGIINRKNYGDTGFKYPCDFFFKKAAEMGCKIIVGIDAHNPLEFENNFLNEAMPIIETCKNNLIFRLNFKKNENIK